MRLIGEHPRNLWINTSWLFRSALSRALWFNNLLPSRARAGKAIAGGGELAEHLAGAISTDFAADRRDRHSPNRIND
jgi:hypothetical protein